MDITYLLNLSIPKNIPKKITKSISKSPPLPSPLHLSPIFGIKKSVFPYSRQQNRNHKTQTLQRHSYSHKYLYKLNPNNHLKLSYRPKQIPNLIAFLNSNSKPNHPPIASQIQPISSLKQTSIYPHFNPFPNQILISS